MVRLLKVARAECERVRAPTENRTVTVKLEAHVGTVTFHLPKGMLGGDFIIRIDRNSGKVIRATFWR